MSKTIEAMELRIAESKIMAEMIDAQALSIKSQLCQRILNGSDSLGSLNGVLSYATYLDKVFKNTGSLY